MRALTYAAFGATPAVATLPDPTPPPGGAVVRVLFSGLCRSDWHGWMGHDSDITTFPHVPGHELAGVVEAVADDVDAGWLGRAVTAPFVMACGACPVCSAGAGQVCPNQRQPGFTDPGSFAELVVVHAAETNLVALPAGLEPGWRPAWGAACDRLPRGGRQGRRSRRRLGARLRLRWGRPRGRRDRPKPRGVRLCRRRLCLLARPGAVPRRRRGGRRLDRGRQGARGRGPVVGRGGVSVSIDALGSPVACRTGILALGRRGRHVQVGLLPPAAGPADVPMERVIGWELDVLGSHGMAAADFGPLLDDVASGRLDLADLLAPGRATRARGGRRGPRGDGVGSVHRDRARRPGTVSVVGRGASSRASRPRGPGRGCRAGSARAPGQTTRPDAEEPARHL